VDANGTAEAVPFPVRLRAFRSQVGRRCGFQSRWGLCSSRGGHVCDGFHLCWIRVRNRSLLGNNAV